MRSIVFLGLLAIGALYAQDKILLNEEQKRNLGITAYTVKALKSFQVGPFNATVVRSADDSVVLSATVDGVIEKIFVQKYADVAQGEKLFVLSSQNLVLLEQNYLELFLQHQALEEIFRRDEKLYEKGIIAQKRVLASQQQMQHIAIQLHAMKQKLLLSGLQQKDIEKIQKSLFPLKSISVFATEAGNIEELAPKRGERVAEGDVLAKIGTYKNFYIEFMISGKYKGLISKGTRCFFEDKKAIVDTVSKNVQSDTQAFHVRALVQNGKNLAAGSLYETYVEVLDSETFKIPKSSLVFSAQQAYIFKEIQEGFLGVEVVIIQENAKEYIISAPLKVEDKIANNATIALLSEMEKEDE